MTKTQKIILIVIPAAIGLYIIIYALCSITGSSHRPIVNPENKTIAGQPENTTINKQTEPKNKKSKTKELTSSNNKNKRDINLSKKPADKTEYSHTASYPATESSTLETNSKIDLQNLPEKIQPLYIDNPTKEIDYHQKLKTVYTLPNNLTTNERQALYDFLSNSQNDKQGLHIKDEIMLKLEKQKNLPPEYIDKLIDITENTEIDGDLRGYCLQHLRSLYRTADKYQKTKLREAYYKGLEDTKTDVAGTALLALSNLSKEYPRFNKEKIKSSALKIATDPNTQTASRITAVQLCGQLQITQAIYLARDLAKENNETALRLAAIGTIGEIGSYQDIELLNKIKEEKKQILSKAIETAAKKIQKRTN